MYRNKILGTIFATSILIPTYHYWGYIRGSVDSKYKWTKVTIGPKHTLS